MSTSVADTSLRSWRRRTRRSSSTYRASGEGSVRARSQGCVLRVLPSGDLLELEDPNQRQLSIVGLVPDLQALGELELEGPGAALAAPADDPATEGTETPGTTREDEPHSGHSDDCRLC